MCVCAQIVAHKGIDVLMNYLMDAQAPTPGPGLATMTLGNLSLDADGAASLMQEGELYEGLHMCRLYKWFAERKASPELPNSANSKTLAAQHKALPREVYEDPFAFVGNISANVAQLPSGRKLITDLKKNILKIITKQISRYGGNEWVPVCFLCECV